MTKIEKANTKTVPITRDHIYKKFFKFTMQC